MRERIKRELSFRGIAKRISLLFLLAALLPIGLLTGLIYRTVSDIAQEQQEKTLVEASQNYAMTVFERLVLAETILERMADTGESLPKDLMFRSLTTLTPDGRILSQSGEPLPAAGLQLALAGAVRSDAGSTKAILHVLPPREHGNAPLVVLSRPRPFADHAGAILLAEPTAAFLWGERDNVSQQVNICAFSDQNKLFCIVPDEPPANWQPGLETAGQWKLFLNGRFQADSWVFITQPRYVGSASEWSRFFSSYLMVALLTVLLVSLLSLIQIRRTMGPLQALILGTRRIAQGDYSPVQVEAANEFGELTGAINDMSSQIQTQIGVLMEREGQLQHQARYDSLTGLLNRRSLLARLQKLNEMKEHKEPAAVLFVDIDRFTFFNDTLGHRVADELLKMAAERLTQIVGETGAVARLGGDEFVVIQPQSPNQASVQAMTESIMQKMGAAFNVDGNDYALTCSIGIALFPQDTVNLEEIVELAHIALTRAKQRGRNNYQYYLPEMSEYTRDRLRMDTELRGALERNELFLEYQPKVDARSGVIVGAEALIRWQHPELGRIPPDVFIKLAEDIGLIVPIGQWVLQTACEQIKAWSQAGWGNLQVAVNLSAHQFTQRDLIESITQIIEQTAIEPNQLELELTETMIMQDVEQGVETLNRLRALGIRLSIDDFGTGYSSLYYLKRFPVHVLKIDRAFVNDLTSSESDMLIVQSIITLAHSLKLQVVAEGVETAGQLACLTDCDCDQIQGYYFSRPLAVDLMTGLLQEDRRLF